MWTNLYARRGEVAGNSGKGKTRSDLPAAVAIDILFVRQAAVCWATTFIFFRGELAKDSVLIHAHAPFDDSQRSDSIEPFPQFFHESCND